MLAPTAPRQDTAGSSSQDGGTFPQGQLGEERRAQCCLAASTKKERGINSPAGTWERGGEGQEGLQALEQRPPVAPGQEAVLEQMEKNTDCGEPVLEHILFFSKSESQCQSSEKWQRNGAAQRPVCTNRISHQALALLTVR